MLTECLTDCMYNWVAYMHGSITDLCSVLLYSGAGNDISSVYYCVFVIPRKMELGTRDQSCRVEIENELLREV